MALGATCEDSMKRVLSKTDLAGKMTTKGSGSAPKSDKPSIFIGSSSEGLNVAGHIQAHLEAVAECTIWNQGIFELGKATLQNLYEFINKFDFAVFIVTPDDKIEIREDKFVTVRDNIIFEIGLFTGGLGIERVVFVSASRIESFRLPSDLSGITHATYDANRSDGNLSAATGPPCIKIRQHILSKSEIPSLRRKEEGELTFTGAICFRHNNNIVEYLLVNSTQGRVIFPKGHLQTKDSSAVDGAVRLAKKEAGARGRMIEGITRYINYYNEEVRTVHRIKLFLFETTQALQVDAPFRNPKWYTLDAAITSLTEKRDYNTSYELARAMQWAEEEIQAYLKRSQ
jgi:predicted nucleotide-binding protein